MKFGFEWSRLLDRAKNSNIVPRLTLYVLHARIKFLMIISITVSTLGLIRSLYRASKTSLIMGKYCDNKTGVANRFLINSENLAVFVPSPTRKTSESSTQSWISFNNDLVVTPSRIAHLDESEIIETVADTLAELLANE